MRVAAVADLHGNLPEVPESVPDLRWTYLEDSACAVGGLTIWGSPWTPWFYDWAFNAPRVSGETFLRQRYGHIHEGRGSWPRGATQLANVAAVDEQYRLHARPVVAFDL